MHTIDMNIYLLCVLIYFVRIVDTSLATIRTIFIIRNKIVISTVIAFFEILVWFLIVKEAINTGNNIFIAISYSLGFASGIFLGIFINEKLITSILSVNIIINQNRKEIIEAIKENGFAFSLSKVKGRDLIKNKDLLFIVTTNKKLKLLKKLIISIDPDAFIVVAESKYIYNGYY